MLDEPVGYLTRAHLRFFIVGGNVARRRYQHPFFERKRALFTAVKEKGDMGVFLGLGNAELPYRMRAQDLSEDMRQPNRPKGHRQIEDLVVGRQTHKG